MTTQNQRYKGEFQSYFFLDKKIKKDYQSLEELRYRYESKNKYTSLDYNDLGIGTKGYNMDYEVLDFADTEKKILDRIERLKERMSLFHSLIGQLPANECSYLQERYKQGNDVNEKPKIEQKVIEFVEEMEEFKLKISPIKISGSDNDEIKERRQAKIDKRDAWLLAELEEREEQKKQYNEWIESILENESLAKSLEERGVLEKLKK